MSKKREYFGRSLRVPLEKIDRYRWRIPQTYKSGMRVPGIIFADEDLLEKMSGEELTKMNGEPGTPVYDDDDGGRKLEL